MNESSEERIHVFSKRSIWQNLTDWIFGYDIFISYSRQDASDYAHALESEHAQRIIAFSASSNHLALVFDDLASGVVIRHGSYYERVLRLDDARSEPGQAALDPAGKWFA